MAADAAASPDAAGLRRLGLQRGRARGSALVGRAGRRGRGGGGCGPVKRAWLHAWNVTDLEITGGGTLHGGGQYWWCARLPDAALARKPDWCAAANRTLRNMCPPRMIHLVESRAVRSSELKRALR